MIKSLASCSTVMLSLTEPETSVTVAVREEVSSFSLVAVIVRVMVPPSPESGETSSQSAEQTAAQSQALVNLTVAVEFVSPSRVTVPVVAKVMAGSVSSEQPVTTNKHRRKRKKDFIFMSV